jgi:hypothetical protein
MLQAKTTGDEFIRNVDWYNFTDSAGGFVLPAFGKSVRGA